MTDRRLDSAFWALRIGLGGVAFAAGLDKFTNILADWDRYLSPRFADNLPISSRDFMRIVGIIEMIVGLGILRGNTRLGGYVAAGWLMGIAGNLIVGQDYYDIAVRDINMAVAAYTLARLTELREFSRVEEIPTKLRRAA